jgi:SWI/SNF-related matrix-associated actin-dependent regulator 1 of chromatin subfamily A
MTDDLYERYKEALRVGHVAVLRGALEEALDAYRNAASIAPSRALPHTSLGGVLLHLGHLEEALVEYAAAVARAPHDEGALLGQAEALTMAGQRVDAALVLDHVSEVQEASDRLPESADTLRRALELHETPERSRHQRGLLREMRLSAGDQAAEQLLARALRIRDEPAETPAEGDWPSLSTAAATASRALPLNAPLNAEPAAETAEAVIESAEAAIEPAGRPVEEPVESRMQVADIGWPSEDLAAARAADELAAAHQAAASPVTDWPAVDLAQLLTWRGAISPAPELAADAPIADDSSDGDGSDAKGPTEAEPEAVPAAAAEEPLSAEATEPATEPAAVEATDEPAAAVTAIPAELEPFLAAVGVMEGKFDADTPLGTVGESQHQPTGDELLAASEAAESSGDSTTLRSLLLWTARAYAREGRFEAGLDATHRLLARAPGDVDAHLVLVELYVARDWNNLAAEKLALLGRLAELNNDQATRQRLCGVATRVFPKDERLSSLCA